MIIYALLELLVHFLGVLLYPFRMAMFPASVAEKVLILIQYISQGMQIVKTFCHWSYISGLLSFIFSMEILVSGYHFIMWVLRKIPFLGID